ncbi:MAG: hypothetical protein ABSA33_03915 [Candidatus Micrarchaeaceae archaeon]|jgi:hypothetical protein
MATTLINRQASQSSANQQPKGELLVEVLNFQRKCVETGVAQSFGGPKGEEKILSTRDELMALMRGKSTTPMEKVM